MSVSSRILAQARVGRSARSAGTFCKRGAGLLATLVLAAAPAGVQARQAGTAAQPPATGTAAQPPAAASAAAQPPATGARTQPPAPAAPPASGPRLATPPAPSQAAVPSAGAPAAGEDMALPGPAPVVLTLQEAVTRALVHAPQVVQAAGARSTAEATQRRAALGAYLPTASASVRTGLASTNRVTSDNVTVTGSADSYRAGVSAAWDVFTGTRGASASQARANTEAAGAQVVQTRADVTLQVAQAFYDEQRAEELATVARARVARAEQGLSAAERRASVGNATRSDVLRARLELNTARESLRQASTQRVAAAYALGRLVGAEGPADARLEGPLAPLALGADGAGLVEALVREAPSVRAAEASARAAEAGVGAARGAYLPTVQLTAGYDWLNDAPSLTDGRTGWSVGLGLSLPLFDGFQRREGVVRARAQEATTAAQLADARRGVRSQASAALAQVQLEAERIAFAEEAVAVAQEDLRVQQERYRLGASTMLDLLTSQSSLAEAEQALVAARFDYQLARAGLEAVAGRSL